MKIVRKSSFIASPWKNGGGITHEAYRLPATGVDFQWRLSVAQIDASGPFSDFTGYRRTMVLLRGAGMRLSHANGDRVLLKNPGDITEFDGASATGCDLLGGPCFDLNLMTSKSLPAARVGVARLGDDLKLKAPPRRTMLVFCIAGRLVLRGRGGESDLLEEWDLAVIPAGSSDDKGHVMVELQDAPSSSAKPSPPLVFWADLADTSPG
jgi:environmental stress-induced protein Ves